MGLCVEEDGLGGGFGGGVAVGEVGLVALSRRGAEVNAALPCCSTATSSLMTELALAAGAALEMAWVRALVVLALVVLALVVLALVVLVNPNLTMSLSRAALEVARECASAVLALVVLALVTLALVGLTSPSLAVKEAFSMLLLSLWVFDIY